MTTPYKVNKEIKKLNIKGSIRRCRRGYYYFTGELMDVVPSIYSFNLQGYTTKEILDLIKFHAF